MSDTLLDRIDEAASRRDFMLEEGILIESSRVARRVGFACKVAVTRGFFNQFYPYAEDATKGVSWEEILENIFKVFRKEYSNSTSTYAEFAVLAKTYVKEAKSYQEVVTFADGKPRDKRVVVMVTWMPDDNKNPSLVFGVKEVKWIN